jgi:hypothetical protein
MYQHVPQEQGVQEGQILSKKLQTLYDSYKDKEIQHEQSEMT